MRVVLIGSSGFIVKHLESYLLQQGFEVISLGRPKVDLLKESSVQELNEIILDGDAIVFLAALTPDKENQRLAFFKNIRMLETFLSGVNGKRIRHLTYVSSDAVFANDSLCVDESTQPNPGCLYGIMHLSRERLIMDWAQKKACSVSLFRPCAVYGQGDTHGSYGPNRFINTSKQASYIEIFGKGEDVRPHVDINDVTFLIKESLIRGHQGVIHAIPDQAISFAALAEMIADLQKDKTIEIRCRPRAIKASIKTFRPAHCREWFSSGDFYSLEEGVSRLVKLDSV